MHSHPSHPTTTAEDTYPGEDEASGEDESLEKPEVRDWSGWEPLRVKPIRSPPRVQTPPSLSHLLSTTTSELEVEQGEAFLKVKRVPAKEEEFDDQLPDIESISGDESNKLVAKKRKTRCPDSTLGCL
jgi:hypothetical protein